MIYKASSVIKELKRNNLLDADSLSELALSRGYGRCKQYVKVRYGTPKCVRTLEFYFPDNDRDGYIKSSDSALKILIKDNLINESNLLGY